MLGGLLAVASAAVALSSPAAAAPQGWTLGHALAALRSSPTLALVDATQPDRPQYRLTFTGVADPALSPRGPASGRGRAATWRAFAFAGRAHDSITDASVRVGFTLTVRRGGFAVSAFHGPPADTSQPSFPIRAAFYYSWFPEVWSAEGETPFTLYNPSLDFYSSADPVVVRKQIAAMRYGNIDAAISSWWGIGDITDQRFPLLLAEARTTPFRIAIYYEPEGYGNPTAAQIAADLDYIGLHYAASPAYLRVAGRPVVFVYGDVTDDCSTVERWHEGNTINAYVVLKVFPGYQSCPVQPDAWHEYAPAFPAAPQPPWSVTISPGFWRANGEPVPRLARDLDRWRTNVSEMAAGPALWQLISTFNEWGEGTAVESADEWATPSGFGAYLDVLHQFP